MALRRFNREAAQVTFRTPPDKTGLREEFLKVIREHEASRPRSMQVSLGPSSAGVRCDRQLVAKMLQVEVEPGAGSWDNPWFAIVGTAVHAWLDTAFSLKSNGWETELPVKYPSKAIPGGSVDLYHPERGIVVDNKISGRSVLDKTRSQGPSILYKTQLMVYGLMLKSMGRRVETVALAMYPRNPSAVLPFLHEAVFWSAPFDEQMALDAVARIEKLYQKSLIIKRKGRVTAASMIEVPTNPNAADCFWCSFKSKCSDAIV